MADNVGIYTPQGNATTATDDISNVHYQVVKLADGTDGATTRIPGSVYGLGVDIKGMSGPIHDAFGRLRVSDPTTLFESDQVYRTDAVNFETVVTGTGTTSHTFGYTAMECTNGGVGSVIRQSRQYIRYQPGKSQLAFLTCGKLNTANQETKRIGLFDADNGVYLESKDGGLQVVVRNNTSNNEILKANWNIDPMDGTGPSGVTLLDTANQIFVIDFEWLGVGTVRTGFVIDGAIYYVHAFHHANVDTSGIPYMETATLPVRYELTTAAAMTSAFHQICSTVISEGGANVELGETYAAGNGATLITNITTRRPICSIRPTATFNSITNRIPLFVESMAITSVTASVYWELVYGATSITNSSWAATVSAVDVDVAGTAIVGGSTIASGYCIAAGTGGNARGAAEKSLLSRYPMTLDVAGTAAKTLSVVVTALQGGTAVSGATLTWRELV